MCGSITFLTLYNDVNRMKRLTLSTPLRLPLHFPLRLVIGQKVLKLPRYITVFIEHRESSYKNYHDKQTLGDYKL